MQTTKATKDFAGHRKPHAQSIRSVDETLSTTDHLAANSIGLLRKPLPSFTSRNREFYLPRYLFVGPKGGVEPIRVGFFAGVYGDEPEGTFALLDFVEHLEKEAEIAHDYCLFLYPIVNPTGFAANTKLTQDGVNIANEIWKNSTSTEVQALQSELWMHGFDGIVSFRTASHAEELSVAIGGPIFFRHLLGTTLPSVQDILPQVVNSGADALPRWKSILLDEPNELIRAAPGLKPRPFEIVITLPKNAPLYRIKTAASLLLQSVLVEYRKFIAFGANI
jgi:murein peptide amidase A